MTDAVYDSYCGHGAADDGQDAYSQIVQRRVLFLVNDVDGFNFSEKINFLERFVTLSLASSQRVPVFFSCFYKAAFLIKHNRNYFQVIVKVNLFVNVCEVLDEFSAGDISFQILDVLLHHFGLVCNREIKGVVSQAELENVQFV